MENNRRIDFSIIIVSYNCREQLKVTLEAVYASKTSYNYEVIIVDNVSIDGTETMVRNDFLSKPEIASKTIFLPNQINEGFGKGNNRGMRLAKGDYLLLLNPDTRVEDTNFQIMMDFMKLHPEIGMSTCKLVRASGQLDWACRRSEATPWVSLTRIIGLQKLFPNSKLFGAYNLMYKSVDEETEIGCCSGAYMFISRECYDKVGGFDENFFMYCEDNDLCRRTRDAGYKIWYYPKTYSYHYKGESTKKAPAKMLKAFHDAMWLYYKKYYFKKYGRILAGVVYLAIQARLILKLIANYFRKEKYVSK